MSIEFALHEGQGIIRSSAHPGLRNQFTRAVATGRLVRLYPGVLVAADHAADPLVRARAALAWNPGLVLMGPAAARASFWPEAPVGEIDLAGIKGGHIPRGVRLHQIEVPADLRCAWNPGYLTAPALTAIDLAVAGYWAGLCHALRTRIVDLDDLYAAGAMVARRRGRAARAECLVRASGNPWSVPELDLHQLYRTAGITGWVGNQPIRCNGRVLIPDVAFHASGVIVEVDSYQYHAHMDGFESDRERHNLLVACGWTVLHVTPRMIWQCPQTVLGQTRAVLSRAGREYPPARSRGTP